MHVSVSLRTSVALFWASISCCCCSSSALTPSCQLLRRCPLSSSNSKSRRSLYLYHSTQVKRTGQFYSFYYRDVTKQSQVDRFITVSALKLYMHPLHPYNEK